MLTGIGKKFTTEDFFMTETNPETKYERFTNRNTIHYEQVKLLMADIFFILHFVDLKKFRNPIFLAIGAAPGHHYAILHELFPMIEFHLFDTRPFQLKKAVCRDQTLIIHQQYFSHNDAYEWRKSASQRGLYVTSETKEKISKAIYEDMSMQKEWIEIMNPQNAAIKTKFPHIDDGEEDTEIEYFDGYLCKQQFAPQTSSEARLIPFFTRDEERNRNIYATRQWSARKYQDQFFYSNMVIRHSNFNNPFTGTLEPIYNEDLINDFDSTATAIILAQYLNKISGIYKPNIQEVQKLFDICMHGINDQRKIPLEISTLRTSIWKSSTLPRSDKDLASKIREEWKAKNFQEKNNK